MSKNVIDIQNLNKTYENYQAVSALSFSVEESTCFGMLGPNGAGKTTTMKTIYGKAKRDLTPETQVRIFNLDPLRHELQIKYLSGLVPQEDNLDAELSVQENLLIYSKFYALPRKQAETRIEELLHFMDLVDKKKAKIRELSGGMKRRLVIARALINNPKLLLMDEPTTGLDPQVRHVIWNKIRQLKKDGVTILLTTHYMDEAFQVCDKIMIMDKGKKILEGAPHDLLEQNIEKFVLEIKNFTASPNEKKLFDHPHIRFEEAHGTLFFYSSHFDLLKNLAQTLNLKNYFIRQSHLEDLFLKITGRELNDVQ